MQNDLVLLKHFILRHPRDAARILERLEISQVAAFIETIPVNLAVSLFHNIERYTAVKCLEALEITKAADILEHLSAEFNAVFLRRLKPELRESILEKMSQEVAMPLQRLLYYPANSAGSFADPFVLTLPDDLSVEESLQRISNHPEKAKYYIYILDREQRLSGVISIPELMLAKPEQKLSDIMNKNISGISAISGIYAIINDSGWQTYHILPVIEENNLFLGTIHYEKLKRIEEESKKRVVSRHIVATGNALGELYLLGFTGLIQTAATPFKNKSD